MNVLITGATGFVGSHLSQQLESSGHRVYSLCRSPEKFTKFQVGGTMVSGSLHHDDNHQWVEDLPDQLDAVIHTAGIVHSLTHQSFYETNTHATENLIEDLKNKYPQLKFIFISSLAACGPSKEGEPHSESMLPSPVNHYGQSKLLAEQILLEKSPERWQKIIIRPPIVMGPRDPAIVDVFKMVKSRLVLIPGLNGLNGHYSFISVFDLVNIIQLAMEKNQQTDREIYFAASPQVITFGQIISEVKNLLGIRKTLSLKVPIFMVILMAKTMAILSKLFPKAQFRLTPDKTYELKEPLWVCHGKKSSEELNYQYEWDLEQTLKVTYKDYQERGWV